MVAGPVVDSPPSMLNAASLPLLIVPVSGPRKPAAWASSAPVLPFFYFLAIYVLATLRRIDLHPVNYFFIAGAFCAFHLLFASAADHLHDRSRVPAVQRGQHRLRTIRRAHHIVVLEQGRVAESGTHAELIERKGVYAELWREQDRARGWRLVASD